MQFERAVQTLSDGGVEFVLIGGVSATFHGDLPSLIQAKRAAGREKDLSALAELESLLDAEEPEG